MSRNFTLSFGSALLASTALIGSAHAGALLTPGDLLVSSSTYVGNASTVTVGQALPGGGNAVANGTYPGVFNNASVDASFGVTSPLFLTQFSNAGAASAPVLTPQAPINLTALTGVATSFPSKSEGALNVSPDGQNLTFVDYLTTPNKLDVSNSNTPGIAEPGNYTQNATARTIVNLNTNGVTAVVPTNAYPGNNGRAAVNVGNGTYVLAGNAGNANGGAQVAAAAGLQVVNPSTATSSNGAFNTTMGGSFNSGITGDKAAKDNNFRGLTVFNGVVYTTKGSGGNGVDTVYSAGPASSLNPSTAISILPGFPTGAAKTNTANFFPFGLFFANATTLYVADEGAGTATGASTDGNAGLEKWSLKNGQWVLDYTLQNGLGLGVNYTVTGTDFAGDSGSYTAATDGLRNLAGTVNADGTVTLYAVSSTISNSGDQGADPNKVFEINDLLSATVPPPGEAFNTVETAGYGQVLRGVAIAPADPVPEPATLALLGAGVLGLGALRRRR